MTMGMSYFRSVCWYPAGTANTESGIELDEKSLDSMVVSNIHPPGDAPVILIPPADFVVWV